jgi:hypothetical protein
MKRVQVVLTSALLSGCAATPAPAVQEVAMPVMVPCVKDVPVRPQYEFELLSRTVSDGEKVLALARDYLRMLPYEQRLRAVIDGCIVQAP